MKQVGTDLMGTGLAQDLAAHGYTVHDTEALSCRRPRGTHFQGAQL
jgi:hypothetical protein